MERRVRRDRRRDHCADSLYAGRGAYPRRVRPGDRHPADSLRTARLSAHRRGGADQRSVAQPRRLAFVPHLAGSGDGRRSESGRIRELRGTKRRRCRTVAYRRGAFAERGARSLDLPRLRRRERQLRYGHYRHGAERRPLGKQHRNRRRLSAKHGGVLRQREGMGTGAAVRAGGRADQHRCRHSAPSEQYVGHIEPRPRL